MKRTRKLFLAVLLLGALLLLVGCGGKQEAKSADLQKLYDELLALPDMPEMLPLTEKRIRNYYGIDPDVCPQALLAVCSDGLRVDENWLVETGSEDAAKALIETAKSRIEQLCTETENYLPDQYVVAKDGRTVQIGSSMALFISPQAETMVKLFQEAFR